MSGIELIENQQDLANWVRSTVGKLDIAVAFWGAGAVKHLRLDRKNLDLRVLLDVGSGGSNPEEIERLCALPNASVLKFPRLHSKAYIAPNRILLIRPSGV